MPPIEYDPIEPPDMRQELRLPLDALRWMPSWLGNLRVRRAERARRVVLLPGFGAGPKSLKVMAAFLRRHGHHVCDWGQGRNTGDVRRHRAALGPTVEALVARHGEPVVLVGWSLGGYIAREYAREHPGQVAQVITLGSPVIGGPRYTATAAHYLAQGHDLDQIESAIKARYATPITVPIMAIYSKRDGVVAWQACIDRWSPNVRHVEVNETHVGLGFAPRVLELIARELDPR